MWGFDTQELYFYVEQLEQLEQLGGTNKGTKRVLKSMNLISMFIGFFRMVLEVLLAVSLWIPEKPSGR